MQGEASVIERLNQALKAELTAVNQYFLHARMFGNWGLETLEKKVYDESIDEMKHADALIERILMLEGLPNVQDLGKINIGETVRECLEADLALEREAHPMYREAIIHCESVGDHVSRELFVRIQTSEEQHIDWLETQLSLIGKLGEQNYLQSQL